MSKRRRFSFEGFTPEQQKVLRAMRRDYLRLVAEEVALFFTEIDRKEEDSHDLWVALTSLLVHKEVITTEELASAVEESRARMESHRVHERERRVSEFEQRMDQLHHRLQSDVEADEKP